MPSRNYTKKDVADRIVNRLGYDRRMTHEVVSGVFEVVREMMSEDSDLIKLEVRNFGTLTVKPTRAKPRARNPRTNEEVYVPPHRKSHFKPGRLLKQKLQIPLPDTDHGS